MDTIGGTVTTTILPTPGAQETFSQPASSSTARVVSAFDRGTLYLRTPATTDDRNTTEPREISYLNQKIASSVGTTHPVRGGCTSSFGGKEQIIIVDPRPLFHYKSDGHTCPMRHMLRKTGVLDHHTRLLSSTRADQQKSREINQRFCSHYPEWTSGHLKNDGGYSARKPKRSCKHYQLRNNWNETLLEGYCIDNMAGVAAFRPQLISTYKCTDWSAMLRLKQMLSEKVDGCPPLPMAFFHSHPVVLRSVISIEEEGYNTGEVAAQLDRLKDFASANNVNPDTLGQLLARLPEKTVLRKIMAMELPLPSPVQEEAKELATTLGLGRDGYWHPDYSFPPSADFQMLAEAGADFEKLIPSPLGRDVSLIIYSLFWGTMGKDHCFVDYPEQRDTLLTSEQQFAKAQEIESRIAELISVGILKPADIRLDGTYTDFLMCINPFALIALLEHGATIDQHENYLLGSLLASCHNALQGLDREQFDIYMDRFLALTVSTLGWAAVNCSVKSMLLGGIINILDKAQSGTGASYLTVEWFQQSVQAAFCCLTKGARCTLSDCEKQQMSAIFQSHPQAFRQAYGGDDRQLFALLNSFNEKNIQPKQETPLPRASAAAESKTSMISQLVSLFNPENPQLGETDRLDEKIQRVLDTYYSAPGPGKAQKELGYNRSVQDTRPRQLHDSDHAVRAALLSRMLIQLLQTTDPQSAELLAREPELMDLVTIAGVYHDVVAEDQPKDQEEIQSAIYMLRDLTGLVSDHLLTEAAVALANKNSKETNQQYLATLKEKILMGLPQDLTNQLPPEVWQDLECRFFQPGKPHESELQRWLLSALRFGDTVDIARCFGQQGFKWDHLQTPIKPGDSSWPQLESLVRGGWELAAVSGGTPFDSSYFAKHGLRNPHSTYRGNALHNAAVREKLCESGNVWQAIRQQLDDMARRTVALRAGFKTASTECESDCSASAQPSYRLIYDEQDLAQVPLPQNLTELETLWISQGRFEWLSTEQRSELEHCIARLEESAIQHPLGTLDQEIFTCTAAANELQRRGFSIRTETRLFDGHPVTVHSEIELDPAQLPNP